MEEKFESSGAWRRTVRFLSHDSGAFAQFVKYGVIGVLATCVQTGVFYALASTCLKCLTSDDLAVKVFGLPAAAFTLRALCPYSASSLKNIASPLCRP